MSRCGECKLGRNEKLSFYCEENLEYEECISRLQYALNTLSADKPDAIDLSNVYSTAYKLGYEKGRTERPSGEWLETAEGTVCSNCGAYPYDDGEYHIANWHSDFCPQCGAKMKRSK